MLAALTVTPWFIYWFTRLDHILSFLNGLSFIGGLIIIISLIAFAVSFCILQSVKISTGVTTAEQEMVSYINKIAGIVLAVSFTATTLLNFGSSLIPTTKEMAAIYVVPKILNNEKVQNVGSEFVDLANVWLKELQPSNIKNKEMSK